ncbi:phage tail protein [Limnoglobus roseus]|uniref:Phage tail protein n=1 Tax=Limnoglobus roseus TaxID=2598579 RepID=A0A5C1ACH0_9BACT|nr:phage tail protein [Limnoglobus roseus]QEL14738.1 hypothetical protein PX52LOC_01632 [Limnoglobus roseus]
MPAAPQEPYKVARFLVEVDGLSGFHVSRVSGLKRMTAVDIVREGDAPQTERATPGLTSFAPVVLERPRTDDKTFQKWADQVSGRTGQGSAFRKMMAITLLTAAGQPAVRFKLFNCWPSKFVAFRFLNAESSEVVVERLVIQHEGWELDDALVPPLPPAPQ